MADMHLPPQAFPDASSILGPYLELSDQGIGKLRNHSRSHEFSVYDNTDPVKLLEVTAEESVALATNCKAEDHFFDLPPDEHLPASMFTDPIERLDPEIEHDDSAFACAFASAMDPVHLYALQKGGIKYWEKNNVRMNAVVERVTEAEEKMNAPLAREGAKKLRRYRKTWTRLQEICTEARHEKREAVRQRSISHPEEFLGLKGDGDTGNGETSGQTGLAGNALPMDFTFCERVGIFAEPPKALSETEKQPPGAKGWKSRDAGASGVIQLVVPECVEVKTHPRNLPASLRIAPIQVQAQKPHHPALKSWEASQEMLSAGHTSLYDPGEVASPPQGALEILEAVLPDLHHKPSAWEEWYDYRQAMIQAMLDEQEVPPFLQVKKEQVTKLQQLISDSPELPQLLESELVRRRLVLPNASQKTPDETANKTATGPGNANADADTNEKATEDPNKDNDAKISYTTPQRTSPAYSAPSQLASRGSERQMDSSPLARRARPSLGVPPPRSPDDDGEMPAIENDEAVLESELDMELLAMEPPVDETPIENEGTIDLLERRRAAINRPLPTRQGIIKHLESWDLQEYDYGLEDPAVLDLVELGRDPTRSIDYQATLRHERLTRQVEQDAGDNAASSSVEEEMDTLE